MEKGKLEAALADLVCNSPENVITELRMLRLYDPPLVGIAAADDPCWEQLREPAVVGPRHRLPSDWLPGAQSVISYFLPFTEAVRRSNDGEGKPSLEWLYGRYEGERFNNIVRTVMIDWFQQRGGQALAPALDPHFTVSDLRSNWSERHVAFMAGLGTFCLNRSLITQAGSAGRFGSVIVDRRLEVTPRPYQAFDEYCSRCGACIARCPAQAITEAGKDQGRCARFVNGTLELFRPRYGCGKCQTAVPCEAGIPG